VSAPGDQDTLVLFAFSNSEPNLSSMGDPVHEAVSSGFARRGALDITAVADGARRVVIVGLGNSSEATALLLTHAGGAVVRFLKYRGVSQASFLLPELPGIAPPRTAALLVSGAAEGAYNGGRYKSGKPEGEWEALAIVSEAPGVAEAANDARLVAEGAALTRDLVNTPANDLPPVELARRASEAVRAVGVDVEVLDQGAIERLKMAGILAVASGSATAPSFTIMKHLPNAGQAPIILVGKGITFDTGGISLKPGADMHHMKSDMGGAAAVIGAMHAVGALNLPVNVVGLVPSAENMPGSAAYRPSDILTYANGKTVEVTNTDAEGRLVLADALIYGEREFQPKAMVDLATLTGACVVALGGDVAGLFSDDDALSRALLTAADATAQPLWRLPLYRPYRAKFDSPDADMRNVGDRWGGAVTAALFLAEFVDETPWAHLDIAGPAYDDTDHAWTARGGTGYGVSLLVEYLKNEI
jgi:leucyl aminopeptidase